MSKTVNFVKTKTNVTYTHALIHTNYLCQESINFRAGAVWHSGTNKAVLQINYVNTYTTIPTPKNPCWQPVD